MERSDPAREYFGALNCFGFSALRVVARVTARPYFRLSCENAERMPAGPCVVAPNHSSFMDPFALQCALPRRVVFLMTSDWYNRPLLRPFFRAMGAVPLQENARSNRAALDRALDAIERGMPIAIFPEGAVTRDGSLGRFHGGVAQIAVRAGVPIVPVGIDGTFAAFPKGRWIPRPKRVTVRLGESIEVPPVDDVDKSARRRAFREITDQVKAGVAALLPSASA